MKLAAPVPHPDFPDQELLRPGYELEPEVIHRLIQMGVAFVFVDYPGFDDLDKHLAAFLSPARQKLYAQMKQTIESSQRRAKPGISYGDYYNTTRELITTLLSQGQHPLFLDQMSRGGGDSVGHAMAVAHLSLLLGIKLESYVVEERKRLPANRAKEIVNLGVAGMLHDLGKFQLPEALWQHSEVNPPLPPSDRQRWEAHPRLGYEQLSEGIEPTASAAVLQHHQHYDGSGFPPINSADSSRTLEGKRIHIFARIIYAANLYDRLATGDKARRRSNLEVLRELRTRFAHLVDPNVLRALEEVTPPYPPGSKLQLSDGSQAIVLRIDTNPYTPVVRRIVGESWTLTGELIDLSQPDTPQIASVGCSHVAPVVAG
jgi:hypothetical protein